MQIKGANGSFSVQGNKVAIRRKGVWMMRGKLAFSAALMIAISTTANAGDPFKDDFSAYKPISQDDLKAQATAAIPAAKKILDDNLNDYSKARIKDVRAIWELVGLHIDFKTNVFGGGTPALVFCMSLNGPNQMGGMTGWHQVAVTPSTGAFKEGDFAPCPHESATIPYVAVGLPEDSLSPTLAPVEMPPSQQ